MWRKYQNKEKTKKSIKLAILALLLLVLLVSSSRIISFITTINQPFSQDLSGNKQYSLDGKIAANIVFYRDSEISIVSLRPKDESVVVLHVSKDVYMDLPKSYGSWRVGSIYGLGQEENPPKGGQLLKLSLGNLLGLPIDGLVLEKDGTKPEDQIAEWRKNKLSILKFIPTIKTDLSFLETIKFLYALSNIRSDKVISLDLAQSSITESKLLADSSRVLGINSVKLDLFVRENMSDAEVIDENTSIAIFNATKHPGLAQEAARTITNLGANVVILTSLDSTQEKSAVILKNDVEGGNVEKALTAKRLTQLFAPWCLNQKCVSLDPKLTSSRAQINIILGEDYFNLWHKR